MKQLLKKLVTSTFGKYFYLGKMKFASTEQDCPRLISLNIHESEVQTAFNNLMSVLEGLCFVGCFDYNGAMKVKKFK